jgi:ketosteroid isomerase-like protein
MGDSASALIRRLYAELMAGGSAIGDLVDPDIEWVPARESLLADDTYRGVEGVRRFWGDFLSNWDEYRVEPQEFREVRDQVAVVVRIVGRMRELELDQTQSSLFTIRDGKVIRVEAFVDPDAAREAAELPR